MNEEGEEQVIAFHLPGELIGLDALGSGQHRCQAVALEAAEVCELNVGQLERAAREVPGLQHGLLRLMGHAVEVDQDHLALLARPQAIERLALFLVGLVTRLQAQGLDGERFALPMSRADIASYLDFVLTLFFAFGVAFEIPVATILLCWTGVTTPKSLREKRPYVIVGVFVVGMLLTPPDVFSQTLLAIPMWALWEIGLFFARFYVKKEDEEQQEQTEEGS
jgi:hypothetical protein